MSSGPSAAGNATSDLGLAATAGGLAAAPFTGGTSLLPMALGAGGFLGSTAGGFMNSTAEQADSAAQAQQNAQAQAMANAAQGSLSASTPQLNPLQTAMAQHPMSTYMPGLANVGGTTMTSSSSGGAY
jgi:hypothetical protein